MTDGLHFSFLLAGTDSSVRTPSAIGHTAADTEFGRVYAVHQSTAAETSQHLARQQIAAANTLLATNKEPDVKFSASVEDVSQKPSVSLSDNNDLSAMPEPAKLNPPLQDPSQTDSLTQQPAQLWLGLLANASDQRTQIDAKALQASTKVSLLPSLEPEQRIGPPDVDSEQLLSATDSTNIMMPAAIVAGSTIDKKMSKINADAVPAGAVETISTDTAKALSANTAARTDTAELTDVAQAKSAYLIDDVAMQNKKAQQKHHVVEQLSRPEDKPFADNEKQSPSSLATVAFANETTAQAKMAHKDSIVDTQLTQPVAHINKPDTSNLEGTADVDSTAEANTATARLTMATEAANVITRSENLAVDPANSSTSGTKLSENNVVNIQSLNATAATNNVLLTSLQTEQVAKPVTSAERSAAIQLKRMSQYSDSSNGRQSVKKTLSDAMLASTSSDAETGSAMQLPAGAERQINLNRLDVALQPSAFLSPASVSVGADLAQTGERLLGSALQQTASQLQANQLQSTVQTTVKQQLEQLKQVNLLQQEAAGQLRERVSLMIRQHIQVAEIRLDPAELGQMQIRVNMQQAEATVQFIVQQQHAKELLEQQMPRLREMLQQQGIALGDGQVQQEQGRQASHSGQKAEQQMADEQDDSLSNTQSLTVQHSDRIVDYYA